MGVARTISTSSAQPDRSSPSAGCSAATSSLEAWWSPLRWVVGSRDPVAAFGRSRLPRPPGLAALSSLNQARRRGQVSQRMLRGMGHNAEYGRSPFASALPARACSTCSAARP